MANSKSLITRIRMSFARLTLEEVPGRHRAEILRCVGEGRPLPCKLWPYAKMVSPLREILDDSYTEAKYLKLRRRYSKSYRRKRAKEKSEAGRKARRIRRLAARVNTILNTHEGAS